ncbi:hypothetical protein [Dokdonella sp.]|uniref:hypothetical protein n=1 Tax=Dokdonella sp. TaxID=2291710 RepID=UPI001B09F686|nr:hypothetical protein [Dokdonella sp.]MBO9663619.1 hypothetical protein [Dokdonella sp.]
MNAAVTAAFLSVDVAVVGIGAPASESHASDTFGVPIFSSLDPTNRRLRGGRAAFRIV